MDILPSVQGDLCLRLGVLHLTQTSDMELFDATHTPVRGLPLDIKPAPGALWCIKHVVDNEQGGQLLLVRRLCLVALAPAVGLRPRLGLPAILYSRIWCLCAGFWVINDLALGCSKVVGSDSPGSRSARENQLSVVLHS